MGYGPLMRGGVFQDPYAETLKEVGKNHRATIAQTAIAWGLNRNVIMIPKTSTKGRLKENFQSKDIKLTSEEILKINERNRGKRTYTDPANTIHSPLIED